MGSGRSTPCGFTVVGISCLLPFTFQGALDDMGDEREQRQTLNVLMTAIDEEPLSRAGALGNETRVPSVRNPKSKIENPKSRVGPSAILTRSRTRPSDWGSNGGRIRCRFIFSGKNDGLTSRQESSGKEDSRKLETFRWNPAGNQSRPVEPDQQPEASLAWWVGDHPCEA